MNILFIHEIFMNKYNILGNNHCLSSGFTIVLNVFLSECIQRISLTLSLIFLGLFYR